MRRLRHPCLGSPDEPGKKKGPHLFKHQRRYVTFYFFFSSLPHPPPYDSHSLEEEEEEEEEEDEEEGRGGAPSSLNPNHVGFDGPLCVVHQLTALQ